MALGAGVPLGRPAAGLRPGVALGSTDDLGYSMADSPVTVPDLRAAILQVLGSPYNFRSPYQDLPSVSSAPRGRVKIRKELLV